MIGPFQAKTGDGESTILCPYNTMSRWSETVVYKGSNTTVFYDAGSYIFHEDWPCHNVYTLAGAAVPWYRHRIECLF